jgi:hypothetical protein
LKVECVTRAEQERTCLVDEQWSSQVSRRPKRFFVVTISRGLKWSPAGGSRSFDGHWCWVSRHVFSSAKLLERYVDLPRV